MNSVFDIIKQFLGSFFSAMTSPIILVALVGILVGFVVVYLYVVMKYQATTYYKLTKIPYHKVLNNIGQWGEYNTYKNLREYEKLGAKFLFNVYVPKTDGTTEIDVLMLSKKGLFVFESKNYSGWIFGDENKYHWFQTLPSGKGKSHKEKFYNPIKQNDTHIKFLKEVVGKEFLMHSIIVFSERCTLKNINVTRSDVKVIKRDVLLQTVSELYYSISENVLSEEEVNNLYELLLPLTQVDEEIKQEHINKIKNQFKLSTTEVMKEVIEECCDTSIIEEIQQEVINDETVDNDSNDQSEEATRVCPKCGAALVLRKARKGKNAGKSFWGCSNFPKCRYVEDSDIESLSDLV